MKRFNVLFLTFALAAMFTFTMSAAPALACNDQGAKATTAAANTDCGVKATTAAASDCGAKAATAAAKADCGAKAACGEKAETKTETKKADNTKVATAR